MIFLKKNNIHLNKSNYQCMSSIKEFIVKFMNEKPDLSISSEQRMGNKQESMSLRLEKYSIVNLQQSVNVADNSFLHVTVLKDVHIQEKETRLRPDVKKCNYI